MKFKPASAYTPTAELPKAPSQIKASTPDWWHCVICDEYAVLLHRGTGYCRKHYDERNYNNTLIN